mmetsp:Transcript_30758/g.63627  ORF Transcript_30758/g.63627 Transcript_30758/m.63627 type:complete len:92 (-) Transcript_30758:475-750(-)
MPRVFNLKLEKKFKGGQKEWQTFNHLVLTLLINENLTLFSDVVLCLHEHIQASLETTESEEEIEYRTPSFLIRRHQRRRGHRVSGMLHRTR